MIAIRRDPIETPTAWTARTLPEGAGPVELDAAACPDGIRRTAFEDWTQPERGRHMVRIRGRRAGRPFYLR